MNFNQSNTIDLKVLTNIKESSNTMITFIGFIEKIKNSKIFKSNEIEYLIYASTIYAIERIALGENILQPMHLMAIYLYMTNQIIYDNVSKTLSDWIVNSIFHPFIYCLNQGLELCPLYKGQVFKGLNKKYDPKIFAIGSIISSVTFEIGSIEWDTYSNILNNKSGIVFIIKSKSCRKVNYSNESNTQIIFMPGIRYKITNLYSGNSTVLAQPNIKHTLIASAKDLLLAAQSKSSIIIEMKEI